MNLFKHIPETVPEDLAFDIKSIPEEKANIISHAIGLVLAIIGAIYLVSITSYKESSIALISTVVFSVSLMMVYFSSTNYHMSFEVEQRHKRRIFDHISIYFLIAGSYTPFLMNFHFKGIGLYIFILLWCMVLIGGVFKLFYTHKFKIVSTMAYLVMGWLAILIIKPLYLALPTSSFYMLALGGAFYTFGSYFYLKKKMYQNHLIWHFFVLGGSIAHYISVLIAIQSL